MNNHPFDFYLTINGRRLIEYKDKYGNVFVEGRPGSEYVLNVEYSDWVSIERDHKVVVSVDGLNILTGDATWEKGYIVKPRKHLMIPGWRIDSNKVSNFKFGNRRNSYASEYGDPNNCGVIGFMTFASEYIPKQSFPKDTYRGWDRRISLNNLSNCGGHYGNGGIDSISCSVASNNEQNLGTEWGNTQNFNTVSVNKKFSSILSKKFQIFYDDAKGLEKRGIFVKREINMPSAFPGYSNQNDFGCNPPKKKNYPY